MKAEGMGATEIAKTLKIGRTSVYRALEGAQTATTPRSPRSAGYTSADKVFVRLMSCPLARLKEHSFPCIVSRENDCAVLGALAPVNERSAEALGALTKGSHAACSVYP